jgi:hypothetical protein
MDAPLIEIYFFVVGHTKTDSSTENCDKWPVGTGLGEKEVYCVCG